MRNATWRTHVIRPGRACMSCNRQLDLGQVIPDKQGLLDNPDYIKGADQPARPQGQNVAPLSVSVSGALLAQYTSFSVAPAGFGDPGPLQYTPQHPQPAAPPLHHPPPLPDRALRGRRRSPHTTNRPPPARPNKNDNKHHHQEDASDFSAGSTTVPRPSAGGWTDHESPSRPCSHEFGAPQLQPRQRTHAVDASAASVDHLQGRPNANPPKRRTRRARGQAPRWSQPAIAGRARTDRQPGEDLHPKTFRLRASADQEMLGPGIDSVAWIPGCGYQRPFCTGYEAVPPTLTLRRRCLPSGVRPNQSLQHSKAPLPPTRRLGASTTSTTEAHRPPDRHDRTTGESSEWPWWG